MSAAALAVADTFALAAQKAAARRLIAAGFCADACVAIWPKVAEALQAGILPAWDRARADAEVLVAAGQGGWASACFTTEAAALGVAAAEAAMGPDDAFSRLSERRLA